MAPLTIPSAWLAGHQGYYLESGPETGVLSFILAKRPRNDETGVPIVVLVTPGRRESDTLYVSVRWLVWFH